MHAAGAAAPAAALRDSGVTTTPRPHAEPTPAEPAASAADAAARRDDDALLAAARAGEDAAFDALYKAHARVVHAVALARVGPMEAEDIVQEVFLRLHGSLGSIRDGTALRSWLVTTTRNACGGFVRRLLRRRRLARGRSTPTLEAPAHDEQTIALADAERVLAEIRALPGSCRETLVLRYVERMTAPQIARSLCMTEGSVRQSLSRGAAMLRDRARALKVGGEA